MTRSVATLHACSDTNVLYERIPWRGVSRERSLTDGACRPSPVQAAATASSSRETSRPAASKTTAIITTCTCTYMLPHPLYVTNHNCPRTDLVQVHFACHWCNPTSMKHKSHSNLTSLTLHTILSTVSIVRCRTYVCLVDRFFTLGHGLQEFSILRL